MDAVSYSHADKQKQRIEKFNANPDSNSGIVTVPKTIASGESVTVPAGRVAVLPNVRIDGEIVVEGDGEIFIPAGSTLSKVVELDGDQTISDVKTFLESPIVPNPTTGTQAVNKDYVDTGAGVPFLANDNRVKTALNASGTAPIYACRASGYANHVTNTLIEGKGISSIVDTGVGQIYFNLTTPAPNINYRILATVGGSIASSGSVQPWIVTNQKSTTQFDVITTGSSTYAYTDNTQVYVAVFY